VRPALGYPRSRGTECSSRRTQRRFFGLAVVVALGSIVGASATPARAAAFDVDCTSNSGALATALASATDGDTLSIQGTCTGTFEISHNLTLTGLGGATLDGQGAGVVLRVDAGETVNATGLTISGGNGFIFGGGIANAGTLTLDGSVVTGNSVSFNFGAGISNTGTLTLTKSTVSGNTCGCAGGGIYNDGTLRLDQSTVNGNSGNGIYEHGGTVALQQSTVSNNTIFVGSGVGVYVNGGTLSLDQTTVSGNACSFCIAPGGGIANFGAATITRSTITGNAQLFSPGSSDGGGIFNHGTMTVSATTVSGNVATASFVIPSSGGGIDNDGSLTVSGSTVTGNSASFGGGIVNRPGGVVTITNTTIAGNSASSSGGGIFTSGPTTLTLAYDTISGNAASGSGGGIFITGSIPAVLGSTIVAGQTAGDNCSGPVSDGGYNLDDGMSCGFSSANTSLSNTDPLLDPAGLQNNSGPTSTIALEPGSPAIDTIPSGANGCGTTVTTDQRGVKRPQGRACDGGAFEAVPADGDLALTNVPSNITTNATSPSGAVVTYTNPTVVDEDSPLPAVTCMPASGATFSIGTTTVTCSVSAEGDSNSPVTASFTVTVKGAAAQLADLLSAVTGIGTGTSLADKVALAQQYLAANDLTDACSTLKAFISEVNAQSGKAIQTDLAGTLTAAAQRIRTVLGC
jgi:hypothetical protein